MSLLASAMAARDPLELQTIDLSQRAGHARMPGKGSRGAGHVCVVRHELSAGLLSCRAPCRSRCWWPARVGCPTAPPGCGRALRGTRTTRRPASCWEGRGHGPGCVTEAWPPVEAMLQRALMHAPCACHKAGDLGKGKVFVGLLPVLLWQGGERRKVVLRQAPAGGLQV